MGHFRLFLLPPHQQGILVGCYSLINTLTYLAYKVVGRYQTSDFSFPPLNFGQGQQKSSFFFDFSNQKHFPPKS
jgi:hypothetical protein